MEGKNSEEMEAKLTAVDELTTTAALLFFRMRSAAEEIVDEGSHSSGRRSILKSLLQTGPQTVPQMARVRGVSRQHIQQLVNGLYADGLVAFVENPAHKRSRLVKITDEGTALAQKTARREAELLPLLIVNTDLRELHIATKVLKHLIDVFDGKDWKRASKGGI